VLWQFLNNSSTTNNSTSRYLIRADGPQLCLDIGSSVPWVLNDCRTATTWLVNPYSNTVGDSGLLLLTTSQSRHLGAAGASDRELSAPSVIPATGQESTVLWSLIPAGRTSISSQSTVGLRVSPSGFALEAHLADQIQASTQASTGSSVLAGVTTGQSGLPSSVSSIVATSSNSTEGTTQPSSGGTTTPAPGTATSNHSFGLWALLTSACGLFAVMLLL
jgi:hypothetical protein